MAGVLDTYQGLVSTFASFLTVSIHTILYERSIYPPNTFITARKYNYPVRQNRHPKVCKWIQDAVAAVEAEMLKGAVARVAILIFSPQSVPLERFMFDVSGFPTVPISESLTPFAPAVQPQSPDTENVPPAAQDPIPTTTNISITDLEEQLRAVMSRLAYCGASLGPLPPECTFTVCIELRDQAPAPIGHPQPWIPSQPSLQRYKPDVDPAVNVGGHAEALENPNVDVDTLMTDSDNHGISEKTVRTGSGTGSGTGSSTGTGTGSNLGGVRSTPLRSVGAGEFVLEMWVEEARGKMAEVQKMQSQSQSQSQSQNQGQGQSE